MSATAVRVTDVRAVDHPEAMALAAREYERLAELVDGFHPDDWSRPTDCPEWDVRSMVAHVLGGMEACASVRQNVHQMRLARKESGNFVDALGTVQIRERASLSTDELLARLRRAVPRAVSGRRRVPGVLRRRARMHVEIQTFS